MHSPGKAGGDFLWIIAKSLNRALRENVAVGVWNGPSPRLDPELFFGPSSLAYPIRSYAWIPAGSDWLVDCLIMLNLGVPGD